MPNHIQIGDVSPRIHYTADGAQTQFAFPFPIFQAADLQVYVGGVLQSSGYAVSGAGNSAGGAATFATAPQAGQAVTLARRLAIRRLSDFQESGELRSKVLNDELDYLTAVAQQVADDTARALTLPLTDTASGMVLPTVAQRAGGYLAFDAQGHPIAAVTPGSFPASAFAATLLDDADAAAARATLGLVTGTAEGAIPVLGAGGKLAETVLPNTDGILDLGAGTALVLDGAAARAVTFEMTGPTAITAQNLAAGKIFAFLIKLRQDAVGGRAVTLPAGVKWPYGEVPQWPAAANAWCKFVLETWDNGASWDATWIGADYA